MSLFNWSDEYSVGVNLMDEHHKKLFDIINKLHDAMKAGQAKQVIISIMDELISYTRYHFREEEILMKKAEYYGLHFQKQEHMKFIFQLQALQQEVETKHHHTVIAIKISSVVVNWLLEHILKVDKRYENYLNNIAT